MREVSEIWRETGGEREYLERERSWEEKLEGIRAGLASCSVCGGEATGMVFGLEGNGVWIGCDRSYECSRYIEIHTEGWSIEEVAEDWNRRNRGWRRVLRQIKGWCWRRFGEDVRYAKKVNKEKKEKEKAERERRREIFGIKKPQEEWYKRIFRWK